MSQDISVRLSSIIERRKELLPDVQRKIQLWLDFEKELEICNSVLNDLVQSNSCTDDLKEVIHSFRNNLLSNEIRHNINKLNRVSIRLSRPTINIGISGQARAGKSTLLQKISGLSDEQVPTGDAIPVTAVRSKIFNCFDNPKAIVSFHDYTSFRDMILKPYHDVLDLSVIPKTLDEFSNYQYPESIDSMDKEKRQDSPLITLLKRVKDMQKALHSYRNDLEGIEKEVALSDLRQYVAYPSNEQENKPNCPRKYLAVKDVEIYCKFPKTQVEKLGLIDLPGLGEMAADLVDHHLIGLENSVDIVLLVKRPTKESAFWGEIDANTLKILDKARGVISNRGDFVIIVMNDGGVNQESSNVLFDHIRRQVNEDQVDKHYRVIRCDAANTDIVHGSLINPVLEHIAAKLPIMDHEIITETFNACANSAEKTVLHITNLEKTIKNKLQSNPAVLVELNKKAKKLRQDIASNLRLLVRDLYKKARRESCSDNGAEGFKDITEKTYDDICQWIDNGFDKGEDVWQQEALKTILTANDNISAFAVDELNSIRVKISTMYCEIDVFFEQQIRALWNDISSILSGHLGNLIVFSDGYDFLDKLKKLLEEAGEPCKILGKSVRELVSLNIQYRSHLHPIIRRELDSLNFETYDNTGERRTPDWMKQIKSIDESGMKILYREIKDIARNSAYEAKKEILRQEQLCILILHAAAEQFEDAFIRFKDAEDEFLRLAISYRDEIWPGVFSGIDETNAKIAKTKKVLNQLIDNARNLY